MKTNELTIGNYVMYADVICKVEGYSRGFLETNGVNSLISAFQPIPLSEDILVKLGFEKKFWKSQGIVIECFYYEKKGVIIYLLSKGFEVEVKHGEDQFNMFRLWNYVHQLQNIYFLLNNEELTIKE